MLKNVGKDGFEILGQTGVPPVTYPVWLEWPWAGLARTDFAQARARRGAQKSFCFDQESMSCMVGKDGFEILGQTGVPPVTYPGLEWP